MEEQAVRENSRYGRTGWIAHSGCFPLKRRESRPTAGAAELTKPRLSVSCLLQRPVTKTLYRETGG